MSKTVLRGPWPGVNEIRLVDLKHVPQPVHNKGKSKYDNLFYSLKEGKALQCPANKRRQYANALRDWLKLKGMNDKLRAAYQIGADGMGYVMLIEK